MLYFCQNRLLLLDLTTFPGKCLKITENTENHEILMISDLIVTRGALCHASGGFDSITSKSGRSLVRHDDADRIVSFDASKPDNFMKKPDISQF